MGKLVVLAGWVVSAILIVGATYNAYVDTYDQFPDSAGNGQSFPPPIGTLRRKDDRPKTRGDDNTPKDKGPRGRNGKPKGTKPTSKGFWASVWDTFKGLITGKGGAPDAPDVPAPDIPVPVG